MSDFHWKCGNDGTPARPWFVYQEDPVTGRAVEYHHGVSGRLIKFASHDSAHKRMLQLNMVP